MTLAGTFEERFRTLGTLEEDAESQVLLAREGSDGRTTLVRRLKEPHRKDEKAKLRLSAETEYTERLDCKRCPRAELLTFADGEQALRYVHGSAVPLSRLLAAFAKAGRMLSPAAATVIASEVLHAAKAIQRLRPPGAVGVSSWGHGEIDPTSIAVAEDGLARLYDARLAAAGLRSEGDSGPRAPELSEGAKTGTPTGDVFSVGALLAACTLGAETLEGHGGEELRDVVEAKIATIGPSYDDGFAFVVKTALAPIARERFENASVMRIALRQCAYVDEDRWSALKKALAEVVKALADDPNLDEVPASLLDANPALTLPAFTGDATASERKALTEEKKPAYDDGPTAVQFKNPFIDAGDVHSLPGRDSVPDTGIGSLVEVDRPDASTQPSAPKVEDRTAGHLLSPEAQDVLKEISERKLSPVWGDRSIPPEDERRESSGIFRQPTRENLRAIDASALPDPHVEDAPAAGKKDPSGGMRTGGALAALEKSAKADTQPPKAKEEAPNRKEARSEPASVGPPQAKAGMQEAVTKTYSRAALERSLSSEEPVAPKTTPETRAVKDEPEEVPTQAGVLAQPSGVKAPPRGASDARFGALVNNALSSITEGSSEEITDEGDRTPSQQKAIRERFQSVRAQASLQELATPKEEPTPLRPDGREKDKPEQKGVVHKLPVGARIPALTTSQILSKALEEDEEEEREEPTGRLDTRAQLAAAKTSKEDDDDLDLPDDATPDESVVRKVAPAAAAAAARKGPEPVALKGSKAEPGAKQAKAPAKEAPKPRAVKEVSSVPVPAPLPAAKAKARNGKAAGSPAAEVPVPAPRMPKVAGTPAAPLRVGPPIAGSASAPGGIALDSLDERPPPPLARNPSVRPPSRVSRRPSSRVGVVQTASHPAVKEGGGAGRIAFGVFAAAALVATVVLVATREDEVSTTGAAVGTAPIQTIPAAGGSGRVTRFPIQRDQGAQAAAGPEHKDQLAVAQPVKDDDDRAARENYGKQDALEAAGSYDKKNAADPNVLGAWRFDGIPAASDRKEPAQDRAAQTYGLEPVRPEKRGKRKPSNEDVFGGGEPAAEPAYGSDDITVPVSIAGGRYMLSSGPGLIRGASGKLVINVIPWGNVYVDGEYLGFPPVITEGLTAGKHTIRVERPGFETHEQEVDLRAGKDKMVHVRFKRVGEE